MKEEVMLDMKMVDKRADAIARLVGLNKETPLDMCALVRLVGRMIAERSIATGGDLEEGLGVATGLMTATAHKVVLTQREETI